MITCFAITESCLRQIEATVGSRPPETGMLLGGSRRDGVVRHVYLDRTGDRSATTYSPDYLALSDLLKEWWNPSAINFLGFVHSHPGTHRRLSAGDLAYAQDILAANPKLAHVLLPIATLQPFALHPYVVERSQDGVSWRALQLRVLREEIAGAMAVASPQPTMRARLRNALARFRPRPWWQGESFARVQQAYDLPRLASCRLVVVGSGGALAWVEEMARCGVGEFVLVDPDLVAMSNIGTQSVYRDEVGRPKVEVLAERIWRINPHAKVVRRRQWLDDLSDHAFTRLAGLHHKRPPLVTLLCAMTDSFPAQARMNRLALHLGLPLLAAQLYAEGRGLEVVWSYPRVSGTCHRCALRPRFRAFLNEHFENDVTSAGTPIFSTTRLNALKGLIALAMLHHGSAHPRWGDMLSRIGQRTLVQARLHPDLALPVFDRTLGASERTLCDETLWLPQFPAPPNHGGGLCPDCQGLGADPRLIGADGDTRLLRPEGE